MPGAQATLDTHEVAMGVAGKADRAQPMLSRAMELETAKEILAEVFHARPGEVE